MAPHTFRIGGHLIGEGQPVFIIAEAGVNHNGDLDLAHQLIDVAARSGAGRPGQGQTFQRLRQRLIGAHPRISKWFSTIPK